MIAKKRVHCLRAVLFVCFLVLAQVGITAADEGRCISMDFKKVDIHVLIKFISELTGKNFIVDNRVGGSVTIYSPSKVSVNEAYRVFESVLKVNKFTIVPSGSAYKILPLAVGKTEALPTLTSYGSFDDHVPEGDELVTRIIRLKHSSAIELSKVLPKMMGANGVVLVYVPSNSLIVTAPYRVIQQTLKLVKAVDRAQFAPQSKNFSLQYGDAKSVAASLNKIVAVQVKEQAKIGKKSIAIVQADERTNAIVALADSDLMLTIEALIQALDIKTPKGKGDIHTLTLENAKADDVATVVNTLIERQGKTKEEKVLSREVKIVADKATNSLVITARPDDFDTLVGVIKKLDMPRSQVFIEAAIMEASSDSSFNFGVNWGGAIGGGDTRMIGGTNHGGGAVSLPNNGSSGFVGLPSGSSIGAVMTDAFSIGGTSYSIQSILSAVKGNNEFTILSTPQLLTLNNEEARVDIVDNIPFVKQAVVTNDYDISTQSVDYKDVGVKLKITPRIGPNRTLLLDVNQEVSRVVNSLITLEQGQQLVAPTTRKREVETTIRMVDGETAVIAGLLSRDDSSNNSSTPWLGDVPILGWLFKQKKKSSAKTNLYIFISARIINTVEENNRLTSEKKRKFLSQRTGENGEGLPIMSQPRLMRPAMILR
ncbi:type II secretion system secretin GspD [Halodesulfovibrio marinisediminis]|uniref:General secretion pathway protein D n=1 Tax=Halodesulfovibrio marinisediminis DSM 17456 TaxID=1121457 RepID=A0A1N6GZY4_9BACT|nr:type II secretion system secretin GspD [Halodesulfovibrio marinisediminis]SIO13066.1 general secretion pathway protein D [Halodesulfovibrio marinisediminis DSM 17456]